MIFLQGDYFNMQFAKKFDCVITDPEWKGCFIDKLGENTYTVKMLMSKTDRDTNNDACMIIFTNYRFSIDLINESKNTKWKYHTYQIWNKEPIRNWISWKLPLRTTEFILYFIKGNFKLIFKNGELKEGGYKRNSFGGELKDTKPNKNKIGYGMYSEIVTFPPVLKINRIHPHQKPKEFSDMFLKITGDKSVIDPFCGSGSLILGFKNAIGIDITDYYCKTEEL